MNISEYENKKKALAKEYDEKKLELNKEYALSNNTIKIGDMATDQIGTVKVERILIWNWNAPTCVYRGKEYTKAGKPFKKGGCRVVYQTNLIDEKE